MIIYFDTETSGLHPGQICQLSYVMQDKTKSIAKNFFFSVDYVEYGAYLVHGFSVENLKSLSNGKRFSDCFDEIRKDFESADVLVSHNTAFDFSFMRAEYDRLGKVFYFKNEYCTMKKATPFCKLSRKSGAGYKYPKLNELCSILSVSDNEIEQTTKRLFDFSSGYHDARFDTVAVFLAVNKGFESGLLFSELKEFL